MLLIKLLSVQDGSVEDDAHRMAQDLLTLEPNLDSHTAMDIADDTLEIIGNGG